MVKKWQIWTSFPNESQSLFILANAKLRTYSAILTTILIVTMRITTTTGVKVIIEMILGAHNDPACIL